MLFLFLCSFFCLPGVGDEVSNGKWEGREEGSAVRVCWMLGVVSMCLIRCPVLVLFLKTEEMVVNTANSLAKHGYLNDVVDRVIKSQQKKEAVVGRWLLVGGVVGVVAVAALRKVVG